MKVSTPRNRAVIIQMVWAPLALSLLTASCAESKDHTDDTKGQSRQESEQQPAGSGDDATGKVTVAGGKGNKEGVHVHIPGLVDVKVGSGKGGNGVSVKAPFVDVDTDNTGGPGVRVDAPFVHVHPETTGKTDVNIKAPFARVETKQGKNPSVKVSPPFANVEKQPNRDPSVNIQPIRSRSEKDAASDSEVQAGTMSEKVE